MKFELFVALRYLKAQRKQALISIVSIISILGVGAGVAALIVALSLNNGFQDEFQRRILGATSHVNLVGTGNASIPEFQAVMASVSGHPEVTSMMPTVYGWTLLQSGFRQEPAVLKGIGLADDRAVKQLFADLALVEGSLEEFQRERRLPLILLGKNLADTLVVSAGDEVRAVGLKGELSPLGQMPRVRLFRVAGIFESGLFEYDAHWALIPLEQAQSFFSLRPDEVSAIEFRIQNIHAAFSLAEDLRREAGPGFSTNTWVDLNRPLFAALRLEKLAMTVAIGLIILVASLNIVSTLTLMVMEKNRDIAIVSAMGGTPRTVMKIFMLQGVMIGTVGTFLGALIGSAAVWYFDAYRLFSLEQEVYQIPYVPFHLQAFDLVVICSLAVLISFLATLYPARSAARLDPVEALRYE
ncbi:MAG TPA: ABC transporter permease [Acidobacteriota bacterium]|nr:ABC transporter permease [Acidobacteriota bacterium]